MLRRYAVGPDLCLDSMPLCTMSTEMGDKKRNTPTASRRDGDRGSRRDDRRRSKPKERNRSPAKSADGVVRYNGRYFKDYVQEFRIASNLLQELKVGRDMRDAKKKEKGVRKLKDNFEFNFKGASLYAFRQIPGWFCAPDVLILAI